MHGHGAWWKTTPPPKEEKKPPKWGGNRRGGFGYYTCWGKNPPSSPPFGLKKPPFRGDKKTTPLNPPVLGEHPPPSPRRGHSVYWNRPLIPPPPRRGML